MLVIGQRLRLHLFALFFFDSNREKLKTEVIIFSFRHFAFRYFAFYPTFRMVFRIFSFRILPLTRFAFRHFAFYSLPVM